MTVRQACRRMMAGVVMLPAFAATTRAEPAADPLGPLLKSKTDSLCYRREYDAAHLANHPGQLTERIVLSFRQDAVRVELRQKNRKLRWMRQVYHEVLLKRFYARDFRALMLKYGRLDFLTDVAATNAAHALTGAGNGAVTP